MTEVNPQEKPSQLEFFGETQPKGIPGLNLNPPIVLQNAFEVHVIAELAKIHEKLDNPLVQIHPAKIPHKVVMAMEIALRYMPKSEIAHQTLSKAIEEYRES